MVRLKILFGTCCLSLCAAAQRQVSDAEVMRIHRSALLIDTHNDVTSRTVDGFDLGATGSGGHTDIARLRAGGVGAVFFAAYVAASHEVTHQSAHRALEMIDTVRRDIAGRYPKDFVLALSAKDIEAAHRRGKIAALIGIEGGHAIENSLRLLRDYYDLGVRYMTLTHTNTNGWADSSGDQSNPAVNHHGGLTPFGRQVVAEMNRLGMMVDVSHVADATFWDALATSRAPLIASHSSCRALTAVPRNMTDEMIAAMAQKGGVIQVNFNCGFLNIATTEAENALEKKIGTYDEASFRKAFESGQIPRATIAQVVDHIDHAVKVGGVDAVGLGSDFDGIPCAPEGLDDVSKFPALTRALLERGYSASDIRKIYGGNLLRVLRAVEKVSKDSAGTH
jgi:membrane dipeptidase